jgi:hypothetical protein
MEKGSMLYLKDYNDLNALVQPKLDNPPSFRESLLPLIGKSVVVFVDGGGKSGNGFTGILMEVLPGTIRLITSVPSRPVNPSGRCGGSRQNQSSGTAAVIPLSHITAVTYDDT